ncbi:MAG: hypothetical protein L0Y44_12905 [Phycisphaerales bacterium]|nr:hypothetical protein [Phycisphaerales bacterium]
MKLDYLIDWLFIVVPGLGWSESESKGMAQIYKLIEQKFSGRGRRVVIVRWNGDWKAQLQTILRDCRSRCRIVVVPHSYGAGHGTKKLARLLHKHGRRITQLYTIDPVIRVFSWLMLGERA